MRLVKFCKHRISFSLEEDVNAWWMTHDGRRPVGMTPEYMYLRWSEKKPFADFLCTFFIADLRCTWHHVKYIYTSCTKHTWNNENNNLLTVSPTYLIWYKIISHQNTCIFAESLQFWVLKLKGKLMIYVFYYFMIRR